MADPRHYTEEGLKILADELIECVKEDGVWHVCVFAERKGYCKAWLYELARDHEIINKALQRAKNILGHKILHQSMTAKPDNYMVRLHYKRFMNDEHEPVEQWVKDDLLDEAKAKADATKAVFNELHPAIKKILDELENEPK